MARGMQRGCQTDRVWPGLGWAESRHEERHFKFNLPQNLLNMYKSNPQSANITEDSFSACHFHFHHFAGLRWCFCLFLVSVEDPREIRKIIGNSLEMKRRRGALEFRPQHSLN